jgi:Uma2 family endonuclease
MAMPMQTWPHQGEWTVETMWRLPEDGNRYEVIDGVLYVTPSPRHVHQDAVAALHRRLHDFLAPQEVGWARVAPADLVFGPKRGVQPDLFVAPLVRGRRPQGWEEIPHLLLAVEVLSPSTATTDRGVKRRLYQQVADEYWIVDLDARCIERWRPKDARPEVLDTVLEWRPEDAGEPLVLDVAAYFREVLDS